MNKKSTTPSHLSVFSTFSPFVILLGLFLSACSSYGPAPPILVPAPTAPPAAATGKVSTLETLRILPTQMPKDMEDIGTFFKNDGSYSQLVPENPPGPALDAILIQNLNAGGIQAVKATKLEPQDASTLQIIISEFKDKVKEGLLQTTQEAKIRMEAVLVLHQGDTTRTITRTMERHISPKPLFSFEESAPPKLLGKLFSESVKQDLVPYVRKKMGENP